MSVLNRPSKTRDEPGVEPLRGGSEAGWDEPAPPGTSGGDPVTGGAGWPIHAVTAAAVVAVTGVNALSVAYDAARHGGAYALGLPLFYELSSAVVIIALFPLIDAVARRLRGATSWPARMAWGLGIALSFSALHIVGMVTLRKLAMAAVGGSYPFAFSLAELTYEFRKDVVTCFILGAVFWLAAIRRDKAFERTAAPPEFIAAPAGPLWLRDGSARIRIEPADIVTVTSAGNYVEYGMASGRAHLVRGTLAAEEARLAAHNVVRVHRTRLINLARISALRPGPSGDFELTLDTGQVVAGSRRYRSAVESVVAQR
jgi:hypothetical protein